MANELPHVRANARTLLKALTIAISQGAEGRVQCPSIAHHRYCLKGRPKLGRVVIAGQACMTCMAHWLVFLAKEDLAKTDRSATTKGRTCRA